MHEIQIPKNLACVKCKFRTCEIPQQHYIFGIEGVHRRNINVSFNGNYPAFRIYNLLNSQNGDLIKHIYLKTEMAEMYGRNV